MSTTLSGQALILTEDKELERSLREALETYGFDSFSTGEIESALERLRTGRPDLVLTDLDMGTGDPVDFINRARQSAGIGKMLVLVSDRSMPRAATALETGVPLYLKKPFGIDELRLALEQTGGPASPGIEPVTVLGCSPEIQATMKVVEQAAPRPATHVTIVGEPGSGKRLIGRLIHQGSSRAAAQFLDISCQGLSEPVIEGELFGHEDGHVGGSGTRQRGLLEICDRGTLLIDEAGELPRGTQEKLLKFLIRRSFSPLEGRGPRSADVRIIATSSRDLEEAVRKGRFLRELFDRLNAVRIQVPPLRDRASDIPVLVDHFVRLAAGKTGKTLKGVTSEALSRLMQYDWPGNVRELRSMIENASAAANGPLVEIDDLPALPESSIRSSHPLIPGATIQEIEREAILRTLEAADGSTTRAAKILNMSVRKIQYKLKEYRREGATALRAESVHSVPETPKPAKKAVFVANQRD